MTVKKHGCSCFLYLYINICVYNICIYMILDFIALEGERDKMNCHTVTLSHMAAVIALPSRRYACDGLFAMPFTVLSVCGGA